MKVAFLSDVNKSPSRKLLTHSELSLSERSENCRFTRCFLSVFSFSFCLPPFIKMAIKHYLLKTCKQLQCVRAGKHWELSERNHPVALHYSRAMKAYGRDSITMGVSQAWQRNGPRQATLDTTQVLKWLFAELHGRDHFVRGSFLAA